MKGTENAFETIETIETIDSDRRLRFETDAPKRLLEKAGARVFPVERSHWSLRVTPSRDDEARAGAP